jgi:hypothetical protein
VASWYEAIALLKHPEDLKIEIVVLVKSRRNRVVFADTAYFVNDPDLAIQHTSKGEVAASTEGCTLDTDAHPKVGQHNPHENGNSQLMVCQPCLHLG